MHHIKEFIGNREKIEYHYIKCLRVYEFQESLVRVTEVFDIQIIR